MQSTTSELNSPQLHSTLLGSNHFEDISTIRPQRTFTNNLNISGFRGIIAFGKYLLPNQIFSLKKEEDFIIFRNIPVNSFPKIEIVLERQKSKAKVKKFRVERSDNSVLGELLYTRLFLMLSEFRKVSLDIKNIGLSSLEFSFNKLPDTERRYMLFRAKLARKLRFIELFFNTTFYLPKEFDANEIKQTEVLFRGITEGAFSIPASNLITIYNYKPNKNENISILKKQSFSFESDDDFLLLGKSFPTGKITFKIDKGAIANPRVFKDYVKEEIIPTLVLNVFDYQIHNRFEKYSNSERISKSNQKLERFKNDLRKEEPDFLVDLLSESLAQEITDKISIEIIEGLLQYYDFPDRFSVLEPKLEKTRWRVPIALTYPKHEPIWLVDAFVDVKTGEVEMKISFDELLKKGKKKAEEVFSIA
jgi:hypothetical protein